MASRNDYETPQELFDALDAVFHFGLDVCAVQANAKVDRYRSFRNGGGLNANWAHLLRDKSTPTAWCNPPYSDGAGRPCVAKWIQKAIDETKGGVTTVMLLVNDPSTKWYALMLEHAVAVLHLTGPRLRFRLDGKEVGTPSFTNVVSVFGPHPRAWNVGCSVRYWNWRVNPHGVWVAECAW